MRRSIALAMGLAFVIVGSRMAEAVPKCSDPSSKTPCPHWPPNHHWPKPKVELIHLRVLPNDTDKGIRKKDLAGRTPYHVAYRRSDDESNGHLLVFLPGSGGIPESDNNEYFVELAAWQKYHAIGLVYVNDHEMGPATGTGNGTNAVCSEDKGGLACFGEKRLENLEGKPGSSCVDPANSVQNRLAKLLMWLEKNDPGAGWGKFLDGEMPKWDLIAFSGHSQGGGMAAFIGVKHKVHRVVSMSSPSDGFNDQIAPWVSEPRATDADRFYGFANQNDPRWVRIKQIWPALGLPGELDEPIEMGQTPKAGAHKVVTDIKKDPHNSVMQPGFSEVWQ